MKPGSESPLSLFGSRGTLRVIGDPHQLGGPGREARRTHLLTIRHIAGFTRAGSFGPGFCGGSERTRPTYYIEVETALAAPEDIPLT